ncbi:MAG: NifB/NifX family molybdenum-iron cluster-binding protein [Desulfobacterales bacterium]|jgi:predicted Fe-Mo cluster-binding NifX family protein
MKIAVSSTGKNLNAQLDPRFGRCAYYLVFDSDDMGIEVYANESASMGGGAGIQAAQFLASKGVQAVITGNCGPNAVDTLSAAGIELFAGEQGIVKDVVKKYVAGNLKSIDEPTVDGHFGIRAGTDTGRGDGAGRGMGSRRGMGRGFKTSKNRSLPDKGENKKSGDQKLENLREQAELLNQQMKGILKRINSLEKI